MGGVRNSGRREKLWEEGEGMEVSLWAEEPVACRSHTLLILIVSPPNIIISNPRFIYFS